MAKKRVLIVNKFLYPRGGDCIVALGEESLLRESGHETALWGMDYPANLPMPLSDTFAPEIGFDGGARGKFRAMKRMMGIGDIRRSFAQVLDRFRPDTVHFHNIHSYLSPVIVGMAKDAGCRTLWTMHDYKLICPAYTCIDSRSHPCTACVGHPATVVRRRCMKGGLAASIMACAEAMRWDIGRLTKATDTFICPSNFMASMLVAAGIDRNNIRVIGNFIDPDKLDTLRAISSTSAAMRQGALLLYIGRLSPEKGVETLLRTFADMADPSLTLRIYGTGPLEQPLRSAYGSVGGIEFMGHADAAVIARALATASMLICPSECYENNPLSVIEALAAGTPVLGADIGGIPELITPRSGMLFEPGDSHALAGAIRGMLARQFDHEAISRDTIARFSPTNHLTLLQDIL